MKEIILLVSMFKQKIDKRDNDIIYQMIKDCLSLIDKDINSSGGIVGHKLKSHLLLSESSASAPDDVTKYINNNNNVIALNGNFNVQEDVNKKNDYIFFKTGTGVKEDLKTIKDTSNYFLNRTNVLAKLSQIKHVLKNDKNYKKIYYVNDGPKTDLRLYHYKKDIIKLRPKNFLSINFVNYKEEEDILSNLEPIFKKVTNKDVIILDVGLRVFKHIFDYYNKNPENVGLVILAFGTLEGRFKSIEFPLLEVKALQNIYTPIALQSLYNKTSIKTDERIRELLLNSIYRVDYPLILKGAADKINYAPKTRKDLIEALRISMNKFDGKQDIFVGYRHVLAFNNNINIYKDSYAYIFPQSLNTEESFHKIFYNTQHIPVGDKIIKTPVNIINIDIIRVTNINIADGTWGAEFFVDMSTIFTDPINILIFNNLSIINSKFDYKLVEKNKDDNTNNINYRYYIVANLDFAPRPDNYPFDWQHIYISYSISDEKKYGIIQPIPEVLLDKSFIVEGWKYRDAITGIKREKRQAFKGDDMQKEVSVKEEARIGWTLSRANYITLTKITIPLTFLLFLNYYSLFIEFETSYRQIGILTTTFLSGIALYFSAERPQPLKLTTIDLIFIWYYLQSGVMIVTSAIFSTTNENLYNLSMSVLQYISPVSLLSLILFLYFRIKTVKLRPNIS